jgi:hypothetical protein
MDTSIFLAKAWGTLLIVTSLSLLLNKHNYNRIMAFMKDEGVIYITGFVSLIIGILTVLVHNVWQGGWPIIITVFGWMAFAKGVVRIFSPSTTRSMVEKFQYGWWVILLLLIMLGLGAYLTVVGFQK